VSDGVRNLFHFKIEIKLKENS